MRKIITLLFGIALFLNTAAQEINIGVITPKDKTDGLGDDFYKLLNSRLTNLLTKSGFTSNYTGDFYLVPQVTILHEGKIEGGMRTMDKIEMDITATIIQGSTKDVFNSYLWSLSGAGFSRSDAAKNAIKNLNNNSKEFKEFITETKQNVNSYYIKNKTSIIARANTLAKQNQYSEAIAILYAYPSSLEGYDDVSKTMLSIFKQYQTAHCAQMLQQARAASAEQHYSTALDILSGIDANSSCATDAKSLISSIEKKISEDKDYERQQKEKQMELETDVQKEELRAISAIVSAYYESLNDKKDVYIVH